MPRSLDSSLVSTPERKSRAFDVRHQNLQKSPPPSPPPPPSPMTMARAVTAAANTTMATAVRVTPPLPLSPRGDRLHLDKGMTTVLHGSD